MERIKKSLIKRIFVYFCCMLLLTTNIFMTYNIAVHAADDYNLMDALQDICLIVLGIGGILCPPVELSVLGYVALVSGALGAVDGAMNIYDYVTDNGDGTYTISPEFVQAALQAAEELEVRGFTDSNIKEQWSGHGYLLKCYAVMKPYTDGYNRLHEIVYEASVDKFVPCCICPNVPNGSYTICYNDGNFKSDFIGGNFKDSCGNSTGSANFPSIPQIESFSANVPIFSDKDAAKIYVETGNGYKNAENYRPSPILRRHSSYSPTYSGGAVTVNRTVIDNINQKITEVDADDSLSDDQKIEILQQYIRSGGITPTPTPPPGPSDPDYDDNKDLPSGTDLTDTNSWLKKIYLKVCQIYAKMNSAVEDAEDAALAKIQESLDEIIVQLKKIKRWTAVDTVIDGVDAVADWLDLIRGVIKDADEGAKSAVTAVAEALDDSAGQLSTKFPFSIPWDILFFISVLAAEPQVPHFEIPIDIAMDWININIHYDFVVDFSQYQWLSDVSRLMLSMTYAVGLIKLTMNIALLKKED